MDTFQNQISETLVNSPSAVHAIFYALKTKNGQLTDDYSLVYFVEKKLPLDKIPNSQIIPNIISFGENVYQTDVIESKRFKVNQCYSTTDQSVVYLQSKYRPLSGGLEISNLASWTQNTPYSFDYSVGTLGFLAIDNIDNTLVGVTNNHVIVDDAFENFEKNASTPITSSIIDQINFDMVGGFNAKYKQSVLQFNSINGTVNFNSDTIGIPKRYIPIKTSTTNNVDAALIALDAGTANSSSAQQALLSSTYAMPFASSSEIQSLSTNSIPIYSVGRTTGPKGINCPLVVYGNGSAIISYNKQNMATDVIMSDIISYRYLDSSNLPIYTGDSGSAVIGNFGGTYKIVGLAFAGDTNLDTYAPTSTMALACRIDKVAQQLNISAWNGTNINFSNNSSENILKILRPITDTRTSIVYNGKTYFQAGTIQTTLPDTNI